MMAVDISFDARIDWTSKENHWSNRAMANVKVSDSGGRSRNFWSLIDTGADYMMLNAKFARDLGVSLAGAPRLPVWTAAGSQTIYRVRNLEISVFGHTNQVSVLFGPTQTTLLGRTALLRTMKFGMDQQGWLHADKA